MMELKYSEILKLNKELMPAPDSAIYNVSILSNITVSAAKDIIEYSLRAEGINACVSVGDYDNIVQDSEKYNGSNLVIVFFELANITDGLHYRADLMDSEAITGILEKTKSEIALIFRNLKKTSLVVFNTFSAMHFCSSSIVNCNLSALASGLNAYLSSVLPVNVKLIDLDKVLCRVGVRNALDLRYYYLSKALYSIEFYKAYADFVRPIILSANGKTRKCIIFDCDNTLWKGILGEDGFDNIELSPGTAYGSIFAEVQGIALALNKRGILIGICSKNNPGDVDAVIKNHPDMQLRDEHITIRKINWSDKVTNLREIAAELNIGLDSLVFVDDSSFEANLVREHLPEVAVLQVPGRLQDYPGILRDNMGLFYNLSSSVEDKLKANMYNINVKRENAKSDFLTIEDYLASLKLKLTLYEDDSSIIPRISQMSQKTNQFNLTTIRYTENDINAFIADGNSKVYAYSVSDKFGDSGITGLCIININRESGTADINTFLMSCRIIGRNIEYAFMDYLINAVRNLGGRTVTAKYIKTPKNDQVGNFYDRCSFALTDSNEKNKTYVLAIDDYKPHNLTYIEIVNGRTN
ncbi:MAG: HAD-IIIC family phosphatase [Nitrospirae bacterium]|nr:HAD-IIIC family phosphatase [Nitrospirota bacterium]